MVYSHVPNDWLNFYHQLRWFYAIGHETCFISDSITATSLSGSTKYFDVSLYLVCSAELVRFMFYAEGWVNGCIRGGISREWCN